MDNAAVMSKPWANLNLLINQPWCHRRKFPLLFFLPSSDNVSWELCQKFISSRREEWGRGGKSMTDWVRGNRVYLRRRRIFWRERLVELEEWFLQPNQQRLHPAISRPWENCHQTQISIFWWSQCNILGLHNRYRTATEEVGAGKLPGATVEPCKNRPSSHRE